MRSYPRASTSSSSPKVETAEHVRAVDARAKRLAAAAGLKQVPFLMPIIESALGCFEAAYIASASPNVVALTIGLEDYTADIGAQRTLEGKRVLLGPLRSGERRPRLWVSRPSIRSSPTWRTWRPSRSVSRGEGAWALKEGVHPPAPSAGSP